MKTKLKVILLNYTPEPEKTIFSAAKICYSSNDLNGIISESNKQEYNHLIEKLMDSSHLSPLEHTSFTFGVEGISRACSHQLVRHRLASYSQQSQRYVDESEFNYIIPESIEKNEDLKNEFENCMKQINIQYIKFSKLLIDSGYSIENAREDSRFVLPNATETKIILTMNSRELLHFFSLRLCNRAQWEIRNLAFEMLKLIKPIAPSCYKGRCSEGSKTCGKSEEVKYKLNLI
jgi:thymidylate synthase (FAD)